MSNEMHPVDWTSTQGTENDRKFIDKLIRYRGILYQCFPLNHPNEITKRPASFIYEEVEKRILRDDDHIERQLAASKAIFAEDKIHRITKWKQNDVDPYWDNPFFNGADALYGYAMVATRRPKIILEVGAGNSTKFFRRAVRDYDVATYLVAIDPAPRAEIATISDEYIQYSVFDVDLAIFDRLDRGDILFWDGSHVVSKGADVTRLFLEILPRLKPGVIVHIHDITMPYEATVNGEVGDVSMPENYIVGTYILFEQRATVILPIHYLHRTGRIAEWGASFWFEIG